MFLRLVALRRIAKPPPDDDEFQERAGIIELNGGYSRAEAERRALAELTGRRDKSWLH